MTRDEMIATLILHGWDTYQFTDTDDTAQWGIWDNLHVLAMNPDRSWTRLAGRDDGHRSDRDMWGMHSDLALANYVRRACGTR